MKKIITLITLYCLLCQPIIAQSGWRGKKVYVPPTADSLIKMLNTYHTDNVIQIWPEYFNPIINVNDSVKSKLLSILKGMWTVEEVNRKVAAFFKYNFDEIYFNKIRGKTHEAVELYYSSNYRGMYELAKQDTSKNISKQYLQLHDSLYKTIYDSMANAFKKDIAERIRQSIVPDEIVLSVATANIKEAIPILKQSLATGDRKHNKATAELALARLGDKELQKKIINECKYNSALNDDDLEREMIAKLPKLIFIKTQESIFEIHNYMDTTKQSATTSGRNPEYAYCSRFVMPYLLGTLSNKDFINKFIGVDIYTLNDKNLVLFVKKWLIKNKGKYEF